MNTRNITEKECVVGFIDILGFSDIMKSDDEEKRKKTIQLLYNIHELTNQAKINMQNLGLGSIATFDVSVSTFSDNIVFSFPLDDPELQFHYVHSFMGELFRIIINTVVDALHIGVLFRGAISIGRMHHNGNVVAGLGLVEAVAKEKNADNPMVVIDNKILEFSSGNNELLIDDYYQTIIRKDESGKSFLDCLMPHMSYAMYANENNKYGTNKFPECYRLIYKDIRDQMQPLIQSAIGKPWEGKYTWLKKKYNEAIDSNIGSNFFNESDRELLL